MKKALILCIETSGKYCSVALCNQNGIVASKQSIEENKHAEVLHKYVDTLLNENNFTLSDLNAIAVSNGPGSYTGLRIGLSAAKGWCYALHIPLICVSTLHYLAYDFIYSHHFNNNISTVCSFIHARNNEYYFGIYDIKGNRINCENFAEIDNDFVLNLGQPDERFLVYASNENHVFDNCNNKIELTQNAERMLKLTQHMYEHSQFSDLAYIEPFYIKKYKTT